MSDERGHGAHPSGASYGPETEGDANPPSAPARATLAGLDDGFVLLDRQWRYTYVNEAAAAALGAGPEELLGRDLRETMPGVAGTALEDEFRRAMNRRRAVRVEHRAHDGSGRWCESRAYPAADGGLAVFTLDITERREAERRLQRVNETLEHRVAARTAELKHRAQQLRDLAGELTHAEQRERRRLPQVLHDQLQQLLIAAKMQADQLSGADRDTAQRVAGQLSELLNEAIGSARGLSHELSPQVLYEAGLGPALAWLAPRLENQHGLRVHVAADEDADPSAEDVKVLLFQGGRELLLNIVKHAGVDEAWVRMEAEDSDWVRLEVEDSGPGFDPERVEPGEGERLGLFGIRERLKLLGGEMRIDSAPGRGTRITLRAPRHGGRAEPEEPERESGEEGEPDRHAEGSEEAPEEAEPAGANGGGDRSISVVLADDHRIVREGLAQLLAAEPDLELVGEAEDGKQALKLAEELRPDVVVLDVAMPGLGGVEAAERIRQRTPETMVIALSMHVPEAMAEAMREAGAVVYLNKQAASTELADAIHQYAGRRVTP